MHTDFRKCLLLICVSFIDALSKIVSQEGIGELWSGTVPSLFLASNPAVQFMVYESLKRNLQGETKKVLLQYL